MLLNCQCEAYETLGIQQSEDMPVSRSGGDELAPPMRDDRRFLIVHTDT